MKGLHTKMHLLWVILQFSKVPYFCHTSCHFFQAEEYNAEMYKQIIQPSVIYVLVPSLPRQAVVEWQVAALSNVQRWQGLYSIMIIFVCWQRLTLWVMFAV